jgi:hypothetical protein
VKGAWRSERPTIDLAMPGDRDATVNFEEPS